MIFKFIFNCIVLWLNFEKVLVILVLLECIFDNFGIKVIIKI